MRCRTPPPGLREFNSWRRNVSLGLSIVLYSMFENPLLPYVVQNGRLQFQPTTNISNFKFASGVLYFPTSGAVKCHHYVEIFTFLGWILWTLGICQGHTFVRYFGSRVLLPPLMLCLSFIAVVRKFFP